MNNKYILRLMALLCLSLPFGPAVAQDTSHVLKGVIQDEFGIPVAGAKVVTEYGRNEYTTSVDGVFFINVSDGSPTVVFSSPGHMDRRLRVAEMTDGERVVLDFDPHHMGGTVDIGYYSVSKEALTGAVSTVTGTELAKSPVANISQTFAGRFTGLTTIEGFAEPDISLSGITKVIRGLSTRNGIAPLVIIDGVISPTMHYEYLTPHEIESISVLKDAASTTIYGIQGASGAIVITTRRGYNGRKRINVFFDQSFQQMTRKPISVGSVRYALLRNEAAYNDDPSRGRFSQFIEDDIAGFESGADYYPDNDWRKMFIKDFVMMQRAAVNISGGSDKLKYFSNVNYVHQSLPFKVANEKGREYDPTPNTQGITVRSNLDVNLNDYFSGYMRLSANTIRRKRAGADNSHLYYTTFLLPPTQYGPLTPYDEYDPTVSEQVISTDRVYATTYGLLNRSGYIRVLETNVSAQTGLTFDMSFLTRGLSMSGSMAFSTFSQNNTSTTQSFMKYRRDLQDGYSTLKFNQDGTDENTPLSYGKGTQFYYNLDLLANVAYKRRFGDHSVDAMGYYFYMNQEQPGISGNPSLAYTLLPYKRLSMGVTALYGYRDKVFLRADWAYSGSEQFHKDNRYVSTPGVSGAWIVSKEEFLKNSGVLTFLKLRASYGVTANDQLGDARFLYADYIDSGGGEGLRGNPALTAEKIKKQNYGIDLGLFKSFTLNFDYFIHKVDNMLEGSGGIIPEYQGIPLDYYPKLNHGRMENKGFEVSLGYDRQFTRELGVYAVAGFSHNRNKVLKINETDRGEEYAYRYRWEGYAIGQQWGYLIDYTNGNGIFNTQAELDGSGLIYDFGNPRVGDFKYRDLNGDGIIDEKDMAPIGNSHIPENYYSLTAGVTWKNFELSFLLQGTSKVSGYITGIGITEYEVHGIFNDIHLNAWTPERYAAGEKISFPALSLVQSTNHQPNDFFIMDRSYLRLRNVELVYTLPHSISGKIAAEKIQVRLSGQNLLTFDKMKSKHIDPEIGNMTGFQPFRVYNIGINLTF